MMFLVGLVANQLQILLLLMQVTVVRLAVFHLHWLLTGGTQAGFVWTYLNFSVRLGSWRRVRRTWARRCSWHDRFFIHTLIGQTIVGYLLVLTIPTVLPLSFIKLVGLNGFRNVLSLAKRGHCGRGWYGAGCEGWPTLHQPDMQQLWDRSSKDTL